MKIEDRLNKGVPIGALVDIRRKDLTDVVKDTKIVSIIDKNFEEYMHYINSICQTVDIEFFQTMSIMLDRDTLERKIIFSPDTIISTLMYNLNGNGICNKGSNCTVGRNVTNCKDKLDQARDTIPRMAKKLLTRVDRLLQVNSELDLALEFPYLYKKYEVRSRFVRQIAERYKNLNRQQKREFIKRISKDQRNAQEISEYIRKINSSAPFSINTFIVDYAKALKDMIEKSGKLVDYTLTHPIYFGNLPEKNRQKIDLFIASQFLRNAELFEGERQDYLYYVANYFDENKDLLDSDLEIVINKNDGMYYGEFFNQDTAMVITPRNLYERYQKLLIENPNLRDINFSNLDFEGMTAEEVENFMHEYLIDLDANWEILPPGDNTYEKETLEKIKRSGAKLKEEDKARHQERLLEIFMEKKELFDSSDPFFRIKGKGSFDGYVGYIYKNGHVVLDKFFEDSDNGKLADGQAIYAMNIDQFYELSRLSKSEIIKNKLCRRYVHQGRWKDRVLQREILAEAGKCPAEDVKQLIKTGKINPLDNKSNN